jgi:hypothetical protein
MSQRMAAELSGFEAAFEIPFFLRSLFFFRRRSVSRSVEVGIFHPAPHFTVQNHYKFIF